MLDVPVQENVLFGGRRNLSSGSLDSAVFTLDPQDKYLPSGIRRASTTSAVHARKAGLPATTRPLVQAQRNGSIEVEGVPQTSKRIHNVPGPERQRSLLSVFHQLRQTRSAGSNAKSNLAWPRKIFSRAGKSTKRGVLDPDPESAKQPGRALSTSPTNIRSGSELPYCLPSTAITPYRAPTAFMINPASPKNKVHPQQQLSGNDHSQLIPMTEGEQVLEDVDATSSIRDSGISFWSSYHTPIEQPGHTFPYCASTAAEKRNVMALSDHLGRLDFAPHVSKTVEDPTKRPLDEESSSLTTIPSANLREPPELDSHSPKNCYPESLASYAASANFSPCFGSNTTQSGLISPCHLSQPETPVMSEFGDEMPPSLRDSDPLAQLSRFNSSDVDHPSARPPSKAGAPDLPWLERDDMHTPLGRMGGFQGYSLPNHDHSSALTLRKVPSLKFKNADVAPPFTRPKSRQGLVHSWNDGSEHPMTALGELVEDLGYLGKFIT